MLVPFLVLSHDFAKVISDAQVPACEKKYVSCLLIGGFVSLNAES